MPADLQAVGRSDVGLTASSPAAVGETVSAPPYDVQVLAVQRGVEVAARLQATVGMAYQPPASGEEDVLVQVRVRNADPTDEARPIAAEPLLTALSSRLWLFPGGELRDWVALRVPILDFGLPILDCRVACSMIR